MTTLSRISIALLAPMVAIALVNLLFARRLRTSGGGDAASGKLPRVSLLIPARNEEANLRGNLPGYVASDYPDLEILVLDDDSSDDTAEVVRAAIRAGPPDGSSGVSLRLLRGDALPSGWLGKPWACHQLASAASGDILIFCDADVAMSPAAIRATIDTMAETAADVLTAFPRQRFESWFLACTVPLVAHLPVSALVPMPLVPLRGPAVISVGNGQWLAFTRAAYARIGGHEGVRGRIVEDVELARAAKRARLRLLPVVGHEYLDVRMYRTGAEMIEGFRKNLYSLAGGTPSKFITLTIALGMAAIYPVLATALRVPGAATALGLLALLRLCAAATFRHEARSIPLHPVGAAVVLWIGLSSFLGARRGTLRWKGRPLSLSESPAGGPGEHRLPLGSRSG